MDADADLYLSTRFFDRVAIIDFLCYATFPVLPDLFLNEHHSKKRSKFYDRTRTKLVLSRTLHHLGTKLRVGFREPGLLQASLTQLFPEKALRSDTEYNLEPGRAVIAIELMSNLLLGPLLDARVRFPATSVCK